ncbi:RNA-dependent RNA polymerase [Colletotrichum higginsianum IMI 349063]|uniref:RNA-dependent RNA polymerase n=3 Tax=Colletotrichum higginsianum TaxID=80884 RepID=A0A1B7Y4B7_COLHI|nr:RNA-dependent RNA polymerase [Colletotrichum higginsianum IMI 349063]OBR06835.1 RNA-dependent RNA polymerase [Colletotrichum higginsianum IMI 349063]
MEVFLSNVPPHLTDRTLEKELRPYMNALGITEWSCSSKKDNRLGWVIFLYQEDANKFLRRHGKQSMAGSESTRIFSSRDSTSTGGGGRKGLRDKANLYLMRVPVFVTQSNKAPDPFALKSLTHRLQDKFNQRDAPDDNDSIKFAFTHLACGHNSFGGGQKALVFHQQYRFNQRGLSKFCKRMLVLKFDDAGKVEIPYSSVVEMIHSSQPTTFTLVLSEPPRFYSSKTDLQETMSRLSLGPRRPQQKSLVRCLGIPDARDHVKYAGACLVYQIAVFDPDFDHKMIALEKKGSLGIAHSHVQLNQTPAHGMEDYHSSWARFYDLLAAAGQRNTMPFGILVQLQSLVWNNFLHPRSAHVIADSLQAMFANAKATNKPEPISEQAFKSLRENTHNGILFPCHNTDPKLLDPTEILDHLFVIEKPLRSEKDYRSALLEPNMGNHHALVFKAMVTPTRITLHGPEPEPMNRILRRFPNQTSYFIRVTFCDEDGGDLFFNPRVSYDQIFDRYREVLNGGIPIAGRIYQFLGFSHSSLRSHSAWFSAPFVDDGGKLQLYGNIIKALGDFEHIEIPAKCAARIGQAFSETPTFIKLAENRIRHSNIPDVKSQDGDIERVFSDGVGTISQDVLELVWPRLPRGSLIPTCLQIRWGGVKGMLSLDSRLMGRTICVRRESMEKFPSNDVENLEICDAASRPLKLVLNRQMIKIMEDLGVDSNLFLQLQKKEVDRLRAVTADAYNTGTFLHLQGVGSTFFLPSLIKSLKNYGIDYRRDSFLRAVVESTVLQELRLLKHKARIPVPEGATLFGIMDETGFLREGEVYVCYDTYKRPGKSPMKNSLRDGPVLVTRSPALHPGDIQYVNMRTPPPGHPLRNLRNCIAFSQRGHRDLPSMLSGGDLDGDLYNIIWDKAAAPKRTFKAADYPRVTPEPLGRPVERKDMANWFVDFMKSDVLGLIATRHLILSDQDPVGTLGQDCLKLAGLHSTAVDFSKTGVAVEPRDIPKAPQFRPDFLAPAPPAQLYDRTQINFLGRDEGVDDDDEDAAGPNHKYYRSEKILGVLYRNVDEKQIWDEDISRVVSKTGPSVWAQFVGLMQRKIKEYSAGLIRWETRLEEAKSLRNVYEDTVGGFMTQYSDSHMKQLTEVEVFCGSIFNKSGSQTRRQKDNSKKLKQEFDRLAEHMTQHMRRKARNTEVQGAEAYNDIHNTLFASQDDYYERLLEPNREALEVSYACLMVGMQTENESEYESWGHLESFKVIAASVLLKELTELANRVKGGRLVDGDEGGGGGFVGVSSGSSFSYAYSGYDVDVGQFPNYGYSQYL